MYLGALLRTSDDHLVAFAVLPSLKYYLQKLFSPEDRSGSIRDRLGIDSDRFGVDLGMIRDRFGVDLESIRDRFRINSESIRASWG